MKFNKILFSSFASMAFLFCFFRANAQTSTIINSYAAVLGYGSCNNTFLVDSPNGFSVGDTILMIQMKGAVIDSTNTPNFGNILNYNSAGNYEYNIVSSVSASSIGLLYSVVRTYDIPNGKVQFVKVPTYNNLTLTQPHTCMQWNGVKGGVYAIIVNNNLNMQSDIDVSGKGFAGGINNQNPTTVGPVICSNYNFFMSPNYDNGSMKGEGISVISTDKSYGRGKLANGGGGGNAHNAGGGGGSNTTSGGNGGNEYYGCTSNPAGSLTSGIGGIALNAPGPLPKAFLGGGGGSAQTNNYTISNGGNGGGICIIKANTITGNGHSISANGINGSPCINNGSFGSCHDGMAGGGAGGTILMITGTYNSSCNINAKGGAGADVTSNSTYNQVGPGGGGSGGVIWNSSATNPPNTTLNVSGGANGVVMYNNQSWGATPGSMGQVLQNLNIPFPTIIFQNSNLTAEFSYTKTSCFTLSFTNQSSSLNNTITSYIWNFGDNSPTSNQQNPAHTYTNYGTYVVTLTIMDANGCINSISKIIDIPYIDFLSVSGDTTICKTSSIQLNATGGINYLWTPSTGLNSSIIANPVATVSSTTTYYVSSANTLGCTDTDSVTITFEPYRDLIITPTEPGICSQGSVQLYVSGVNNPVWSPATGLDNTQIVNPIASPAHTTTYIVSGTGNNGCIGSDTVTVHVYPQPTVTAIANEDSVNCNNPIVYVSASGATEYLWSPATYFDDNTSANTKAKIKESVTLIVIGTDTNGCVDTGTVFVNYIENKNYSIPNAFSPNGDNLNDEFLPIYYCNFLIRYFRVYNRFGQLVFSTNNPNKGWDGRQNGQPVDIGTYFWYIEGKTITNQTIIRKGDVTLIR